MAKPSAFKLPLGLSVTKTSLAIVAKLALEDMLAVFAIILKKTMSKGVKTRAIAADDAPVAIKTLMKRFYSVYLSILLIWVTMLSSRL